MVEAFGQENRRVPVPRRTIRLIAGGARKVLTVTMLGEIFRCCYYTKSGYGCEGSCAASWVALVFGIDERNVKAARKHLVQIGWLIPKTSDAWHRRRYGARAVVNPNWSRPVSFRGEEGGENGANTRLLSGDNQDHEGIRHVQTEAQPQSVETTEAEEELSWNAANSSDCRAKGREGCTAKTSDEPQFVQEILIAAPTVEVEIEAVVQAKIPTPVETILVGTGKENGGGEAAHKRSPQEPIFLHKRSPQGVPIRNKNKTLFEESKNQKPAGADQTGVLKTNQGNEKSGTKPKVGTQPPAKALKAPTMRHVEVEDLRSTDRTLVLFEDATKLGLVKNSEGDRLKFVAAAERAITVGTKNQGGFFSRIVRANLWHHLTQDDEDAAQRRLKQHLFASSPPIKLKAMVASNPRPELSQDARMVVSMKRLVNEHKLRCDPFELLRRERPDWTRERWSQAEAEFQRFRMDQYSVTLVGA
jgi:hypothetical protein